MTLFVVLACLIGGTAMGGETPSGQSDSETLAAPVEVADRLLAESESAAEAARRWLRANLSKEAVSARASAARDAVTSRFDRALAEARCAHERTLGLFVFVPADSGRADSWRRLSETERPGGRVVLLVHGLDECGTIWDDAAPAIASAGHVVMCFNYPNDQRISSSADGLAASLRELDRRGVERVDIVGHSMGGLVARDVLTREGYYGGDARGGGGLPAVTRLIMIGTPNHGSPLAPLRGAMEVRDQFVHWLKCEDKSASSILGFMVDGDGEAGEDLRPGSSYLAGLNARPMPIGVAMTVIVGEIGATGRDRVAAALDSVYVRRVVGEDRARRWKEGTNGAWSEVGDGAVPDSSARLEGVTDVAVVRADHRSMVRTLEPVAAARGMVGLECPTPPAVPVILDRLGPPER